jgi:hypothetical protein
MAGGGAWKMRGAAGHADHKLPPGTIENTVYCAGEPAFATCSVTLGMGPEDIVGVVVGILGGLFTVIENEYIVPQSSVGWPFADQVTVLFAVVAVHALVLPV